MSVTLALILATLLIVWIASVAFGVRAATRRHQFTGVAERERALATQAEIESHDIEQMMEAQAALRRRIGKRSLGDELADEALGENPER